MLRSVTTKISIDTGKLDWYILIIVGMLLIIGIIMNQMATSNQIDPSRITITKESITTNISDLYSRSQSQIYKTLLGAVFGLVCFSISPSIWQKKLLNYFLILLSIVMLISVLIWGVTINEAKRWLMIYGISFAPSDFARFALIIFSANFLTNHSSELSKIQYAFQLLFLLFIISCLIMLQPNLSTVIVFYCIVGAMMWVAGIPKKWALFAVILVVVGGLLISLNSFRSIRLKVWTDPIAWYKKADELKKTQPELSAKIEKVAFHQVQSIIALNQGELTGVGGGNSMQKYFLPEAYSDSIIAIIAEEWGFIGVTFVLFLYAFFLYRGFNIAKHSKDFFSYLLAFGITINFALYLIIHFFINVAAMPATGLPLPFISFGGTAIFFNLGLLGILLRLSIETGPELFSESI
ncbi:MAG: FtsW/RodA/SpoVE family cell cycle protein [bacterium]|nr:FtsW/RodA/SpoVE family cell cycle protein [bacterium]